MSSYISHRDFIIDGAVKPRSGGHVCLAKADPHVVDKVPHDPINTLQVIFIAVYSVAVVWPFNNQVIYEGFAVL